MNQPLELPKELVILTEHFAPSTGATAQLITNLADDLHEKGVCLSILTSTAGTVDKPYRVKRFSASDSTSVGILRKIIAGLLFFGGSAIWLLFNSKKNQGLFIVSNPPFIGLLGVLLSIVKRSRYIFLLQDIFPRSASLTGILPAKGPIVLFWRVLIKAVLARSQSTVVLSKAMILRCQLEFIPIKPVVSIPNWAVSKPNLISKKDSKTASSWCLESVFTVQYSGNFGRLHDILTLLEAARLLQGHPVKFVFVGGGAKSLQIQRYCTEYRLDNVIIKPYQPLDSLADSLAASDLSVVSLIPGAEDTVAPSKFYGIIASSRPVLLIASQYSELARLVSGSQCGIVVEQGDVQSLCNAILRLKDDYPLLVRMQRNAQLLYATEFSRSRSVAQYYSLFQQHDMI